MPQMDSGKALATNFWTNETSTQRESVGLLQRRGQTQKKARLVTLGGEAALGDKITLPGKKARVHATLGE